MGDVVNLNKFRKAHQRELEKRAARDNRVRFGRTGAEKAASKRTGEQAENTLDGKKRGTSDGDGTQPENPAPPRAR